MLLAAALLYLLFSLHIIPSHSLETLVSVKDNTDCPQNANLTVAGPGTLRYELKKDVLFALVLAWGNRKEALQTGCSFDGWGNQEVIQHIQEGIAIYHDTTLLEPDTPPQQAAQLSAQDFIPTLRLTNPLPELPRLDIDHIPFKKIQEFKADPKINDISDALAAAAKWRFSVAYNCDQTRIDAAMKVYRSVTNEDIIFLLNDIKVDEDRKLSFQNTIDDLYYFVTIGDIDALCATVDKQTEQWEQIPWPSGDFYGMHKEEIRGKRCGRPMGEGEGEVQRPEDAGDRLYERRWVG